MIRILAQALPSRLIRRGEIITFGGIDDGPPPPETFRILGKNNVRLTSTEGWILHEATS